MPPYFVGILAAFITPVAHGWANILDRYFSGEIFHRRVVLIAISAIFGLCLLPIIWLFSPPTLISWGTFWSILLAAVIEVTYLFPYYNALQRADTSVVSSLFSLGGVFVPFLSFLFVGERLGVWQYVGFFIVVSSSLFLTADFRKLHVDKAFFLMLLSSSLVAIQVVVIKYTYTLDNIGWGTLVTWMIILEALIVLPLALWPANRKEFPRLFTTMRGNWWRYIQLEGTSWIGSFGSYFALRLVPATIVEAISGTRPLLLLLCAWLFSKRSPGLYREYLGKDGVIKKILLFVCMIVGTLFAIGG